MALTVLNLVDVTLTSALIIIVTISVYENFVARVSTASRRDWPSWMGDIDFWQLKLKLLGTIVAISAIGPLESFIDVRETSDRDLYFYMGIHLTFVVSMVALAAAQRLAGIHSAAAKDEGASAVPLTAAHPRKAFFISRILAKAVDGPGLAQPQSALDQRILRTKKRVGCALEANCRRQRGASLPPEQVHLFRPFGEQRIFGVYGQREARVGLRIFVPAIDARLVGKIGELLEGKEDISSMLPSNTLPQPSENSVSPTNTISASAK